MPLSKEHCYLNVLLLSKLMIDLLDQLQGTGYVPQSLKTKLKGLLPELAKLVDGDLNRLWTKEGVDHQDIYSAMEYQENMLREISQLTPEDYGVVAEMVAAFSRDREYFLEKMDLKIVDPLSKDPV